ncbi:50S ribosomal subunit protein L6 [uncultured Desulfobacterium sp.]|uniref:Large ribosomal subunit protein uL6 n=1 Tax=uncultured Desulfobacterium sp. TaxID=201089 RepID=A0A445MS19_9BACT|nr:50S ribosomal subunit protein L6 [uncultured Desulfobacterium sp.]
MSRIGKRPITIPKGVEVKIQDDIIAIKGPKGSLERRVHPSVTLNIDSGRIVASVADQTKESRACHGLFRALVANMVTGVTNGFERALDIVGVGYRAELKDRIAVFHLGYSHPINFELPKGIDAKVDKTKITLSSIDKELLGKTAAKIRSFRSPEPYKGKGIKYAEETIRRKAGKAGAAK